MKPPPKISLPLVVTYGRVSTDEQAENGTSLDDQDEQTAEYTKGHGWVRVAHFADEGISGTAYLERKGLQGALEMIELGLANILLATKPDRIGRSVLIQEMVKQRVQRAGAKLAFVSFNYEETPEGALQLGVLNQFAAYEHAIIAARTKAGKRKRASDGIQTCTKAPDGYHIPMGVEIARKEYPPDAKGKYVVVEKRAKIIARAFESVPLGRSLRGICGEFNREGLRTSKGCLWHPANLHKILRNPAYKGEARYGYTVYWHDEERLKQGYRTSRMNAPSQVEKRLTIPCPAIVSPELWDRVQSILDRNQKYGSGNPAHKHLLTGFLRCPKCHGSIRRDVDKRCKPGKGMYYRCTRSFRKPEHGGSCGGRILNGPELEATIMRKLRWFLSNPARIEIALQKKRRAEEQDASAQNETALRKQLDDLNKEEEVIVIAQIRGLAAGADPTAYETHLARLSDRKAGVQRQLETITVAQRTRKSITDHVAQIALQLHDVDMLFNSLDVTTAEKREGLSLLIDHIIVHSTTRIDVIFRY